VYLMPHKLTRQHERGAVSRHLHSCWNRFVDGIFNLIQDEGTKGYAMRAVISLVTLSVSGCLFWGAHICMRSLHVQFWLGGLPQLTLAVSMLALGFGWVLSIHLRVLVYVRNAQHKERQKTGKDHKPRRCSSSRLLRTALAFTCVPSIVAIWLGCRTVLAGLSVSESLTKKCGQSGTSFELEETHKKLQAFYVECRKNVPAMRSRPVDQCPDFKKAFPPPAPFVRYIEAMERGLDCTGICRFTAQPLFSNSSAVSSRPQIRQRCSSELASIVANAALLSGIPAAILGVIIFLVATALYMFDEL